MSTPASLPYAFVRDAWWIPPLIVFLGLSTFLVYATWAAFQGDNRSHYEEVLIVRVHPELLRAEGLPDEALDDKTIWRDRYRSIRHFEAHLHRNGTHIVKFFLHLSKEEQRKRFLARIEEPDKNWKFSRADVEERKYWDDYRDAYEACLSATSMRDSPWYIVPADDKKNTRLIISRIILDTLRSLKRQYPTLSEKQRKELGALRRLLAK